MVFSDEKIFQSHNDKKQIFVYRLPGTRYEERYIAGNIDRAGRFSVNLWSWISARGHGALFHINGRFTAQVYVNMMENVMLPAVNVLYPDGFVYQQDNCPVHTAHISQQWLRDHNIEVLPWPAKSPDANPMENVWGLVTKKLTSFNILPRDADHLMQLINRAYATVIDENPNLFIDLVNSMPRRLANIIETNGAMIGY